jgi:3-hydroxybutyryl-CoA dehydrogenase
MESQRVHSGPVLVVGAGIMGSGIAQVAAQAGREVMLFDAREGAARDARATLQATLEGLAAKGKLSSDEAAAASARIRPLASLSEAEGATLAIEAIVEQLDKKRALLRELEQVLGDDAVLASNTSSISITALANGLKHPERLVGMHFFNPVPVMKLVEVVSGLRTERAVAEAVFELAQAWGRTAVHARSTPGFIVNRIARPFYAETLALLAERAATPAELDACLRGAGFRMGACELMDLIGHDTNFAVTQSVYEANFGDKRFAPSLVQRELVDAGLLGRKSGRGFYDHAQQAAPATPSVDQALPTSRRVMLQGRGPAIERWKSALQRKGLAFAEQADSPWCGLQADGAQLRLTDGRAAGRIAAHEQLRDLALFDLPLAAPGSSIAWSASSSTSTAWQEQVPRWLALAGWTPVRLADAPGLVVARTIAMLINEACDAVQQGVCTPQAADAAMKLGVNYPQGPFEWLAAWDAREAARLLDHLDEHYRGERYRVSPELRQRGWLIEQR